MTKRSNRGDDGSVDGRVRQILATLERRGTKRNREGMARYAIVAPKAFGVSVATIREIGKQTGRSHELAEALWNTGWYEARMLAPFAGILADASFHQDTHLHPAITPPGTRRTGRCARP